MIFGRALFLLLSALLPALASPYAFGKAELDAALAARKLQLRIKAELDDLPADSFKIELTRIRGNDARGLMYGLLEAAEQIRIRTQANGSPLLLVGHEPLFSALTAYLLGFPELSIEFTPATLACLEVEVNRQPRGTLRWLVNPRLAAE